MLYAINTFHFTAGGGKRIFHELHTFNEQLVQPVILSGLVLEIVHEEVPWY